MRVTSVAFLSLAYLVAAVYALPARPQEEVEIVPLEANQFGREPPLLDTGIIGGPFYSPFDGLFESLSSAMARMRSQMDYLLSKLPSFGNGTFSGPSDFPGFPKIDLGKGNTTSVTKVIDGHKVVINETEYKQDGEGGAAFFKVRIIDVQPDETAVGTTEKNAENITPVVRDTESSEDSIENEISKNKQTEVFSDPEDYIDEVDASKVSSASKIMSVRDSQWDAIEPLESFEDNSLEGQSLPVDLSRDIYVNQIMADAGSPVNPDAEVFSNYEQNVPFYSSQRRPQMFEKLTVPR